MSYKFIILWSVFWALFNWDKIAYITVFCRLTNTGLFPLSTDTVHWIVTPIMSSFQDQNSNRVRLYCDWFYLSRGSNATFNDDVCDKTSDLFTHKESNFHSEEKANWIRFIEIKNVLQWKESSKYHYLTKCVLRLFNRDKIPYVTVNCRFTNKGLFALSTNCPLKHDPCHVFGSGSKPQQS